MSGTIPKQLQWTNASPDPGFVAAKQQIELPQPIISYRDLTQTMLPPIPGVHAVDIETDPQAFFASIDPIDSFGCDVGEQRNADAAYDMIL